MIRFLLDGSVLKRLVLPVVLSGCVATAAGAQTNPQTLALEEAITFAVENDPWLSGSRHTQNALNDEATAAATLPDPIISLTGSNLPVNSFDLNEAPMTQLGLGVSQMFPRGDTLALAQRQKQQLAQQHPLLRLDRQAKVTATVTRLWLDAFRAQESIRLIERDRALFEQLADAARAGYSTALGRTRQQDMIRAQLELTRLADRLTVLQQQQDSAQKQLSEWIGASAMAPLTPGLPVQSVDRRWEVVSVEQVNEQARYDAIASHPTLLALDKQIDATRTSVDLALQKYKPEWALKAQYGYRDEDLAGRSRDDFVTFGVSFDLPLFTAKRQDKEVSAARSRVEANRTEKVLLARRLMAELETASVQLARLDERRALYTDQLLPQMADQSEASLIAYNNDDGDFAEAVRARIAELNARIDALAIAVERQQTIARINYLLTGAPSGDSAPAEPF
ncbi:transporter [Kineobactrum sediminis]|uniref:Transporter n=1 Tax=Kineobactrum sediminis TaxID=1905677 RepID=A0A2N5XXV0_9GAMM|nr:TolC family protein [Kineobactrum sediminis]PLW80971.1 transporter [Kineobactrum sediminis]